MNHISRTMFVPNNLDRDTAIRVAGPEGQVGDSVSDVKPVETFGGAAVIEGVHGSMTTTVPTITNSADVAVAVLSIGRGPCAPR
jgi:hypothetical protein